MKALIAAAIVVSAAPLIAASGADDAPGAKKGTNAKEERRVCRGLDVNSASRVQRRRACMTMAQWRAYGNSKSRRELDDFEVVGNRRGPHEHGVTPKGGTPR